MCTVRKVQILTPYWHPFSARESIRNSESGHRNISFVFLHDLRSRYLQAMEILELQINFSFFGILSKIRWIRFHLYDHIRKIIKLNFFTDCLYSLDFLNQCFKTNVFNCYRKQDFTRAVNLFWWNLSVSSLSQIKISKVHIMTAYSWKYFTRKFPSWHCEFHTFKWWLAFYESRISKHCAN